jgi:hypothetical protein
VRKSTLFRTNCSLVHVQLTHPSTPTLGNPWWMIYEDAKKNQIPTATAIAVIDAELHEEMGESHQGSGSVQPIGNACGTGSANKRPHFCLICNPVNLLSEFIVATLALVLVLVCELLAIFVFYIPGAIFFNLARPFSPPNACTGIFYSFFMIFYFGFALCDSILLIISVLTTEILACIGYITSFCTGGVLMSMFWHQHTRRSCHGIRVTFRNKLSCNPPRHLALCQSRNNETMEQQNLIAESVPVHGVHHHDIVTLKH